MPTSYHEDQREQYRQFYTEYTLIFKSDIELADEERQKKQRAMALWFQAVARNSHEWTLHCLRCNELTWINPAGKENCFNRECLLAQREALLEVPAEEKEDLSRWRAVSLLMFWLCMAGMTLWAIVADRSSDLFMIVPTGLAFLYVLNFAGRGGETMSTGPR